MAGEGLGYALDDDHHDQTLEELAYATVRQEPDVIGLGDIIVDEEIALDTLDPAYRDDLEQRDAWPAAGASTAADDAPSYVEHADSDRYPGGRGPNQAAAAALSGADTAFLGKSNGDEDSIVVDALEDAGVTVDRVMYDDTKETSTSYVFTEGDGENRIMFRRGANSTLPSAYVDGTGRDVMQDAAYILLNNGEPDETLHQVLDMLDGMEDGPQVVFDPAPAAGAEQFLAYDAVDIVTPNETEYAALEDDLADYEGTVITTSSAGVDVNGRYTVDAPEVDPVDTTGAGDTFNGYLAGCCAQGMELEDAATYAVHAASLSVTQPGAQPSIPSWDDVEQFMDGRGA